MNGFQRVGQPRKMWPAEQQLVLQYENTVRHAHLVVSRYHFLAERGIDTSDVSIELEKTCEDLRWYAKRIDAIREHDNPRARREHIRNSARNAKNAKPVPPYEPDYV
jgi:hypothetical protein